MPKFMLNRDQKRQEALLRLWMQDDKMNEIEQEIVKKLGNTPYATLYRVTRKNKTGSTLKSLDPLVMHKFAIKSSNLMVEAKDTVTMKDLRCMDRPFFGDDCEMVGIGAMKLAIATLADMQHWSLKDKTMMFDTLTFTFAEEITMAKITQHVTGIIKSVDPDNIFDKKLLLFPTFTCNGAFLTVVKNPRGILVGDKGVCDIFNILCGCEKLYAKKVGDHIRTLLRSFASHFEPDTRFGYADNYDLELPNIDQYDKPYAILGLIEKFLKAEFSFPQVEDMINELHDLEPRALKKHLMEIRMKLFNDVESTINMNNDSLIEYVMYQRNNILVKEQKRRDDIEVVALD